MKMPPKAKIYEAFSVIADNRISMNENSAKVVSSDGKKEYNIYWNETQISSTDNATFWQGYPGYPVIALWLEIGMINYHKEITNYFKNINWHEINEKNKRDYDKGISEVLETIKMKNGNIEQIKEEVEQIYKQLETIDYQIVRKLNSQN